MKLVINTLVGANAAIPLAEALSLGASGGLSSEKDWSRSSAKAPLPPPRFKYKTHMNRHRGLHPAFTNPADDQGFTR